MDKKNTHKDGDNIDPKKILDLLSVEITENNDQEHLIEMTQLMGKSDDVFSVDFTDSVMNAVELEVGGERVGDVVDSAEEFSGKIVYMFKRLASVAAALIVGMLIYTYYTDGMVSPDAILGLTALEEASLDMSSALYSNF